MVRNGLLALALAAACGGGIRHSKVTKPAAEEVNAQELAKVGRITSLRESGGTLFIGAEKGIAAVDASGTVLWTIELPRATARLIDADQDGVGFTSFSLGSAVEDSTLNYLIGIFGDDPKFTEQTLGAATRDGKLLFTAPAAKGITQTSPPRLTKDQIGISRGRGFFVYSRADGHEIGHSPLAAEGALKDYQILYASFNRPASLGGYWYAAHLGDFVKADLKGEEKDRTRRWGLMTHLENLTIGPFLFKDRLVCAAAPHSDKPVVYAFDKEGGKDWKETIDDKESGVGAITSNSSSLFVATNFHVAALDEKGSTRWDKKDKGGLSPGKYRGLRYGSKGLLFSIEMAARRSQGQFIVADEKNVYVATRLRDGSDALTVLDAKTGEYQGSLDLGAFVVDMALLGGKIALATENGLRLVPAL